MKRRTFISLMSVMAAAGVLTLAGCSTSSSKTVFMENGVVVEQAPSRQFFADPKEERTREFLRKIAHTE